VWGLGVSGRFWAQSPGSCFRVLIWARNPLISAVLLAIFGGFVRYCSTFLFRRFEFPPNSRPPRWFCEIEAAQRVAYDYGTASEIHTPFFAGLACLRDPLQIASSAVSACSVDIQYRIPSVLVQKFPF
jgi:hypothetical protein